MTEVLYGGVFNANFLFPPPPPRVLQDIKLQFIVFRVNMIFSSAGERLVSHAAVLVLSRNPPFQEPVEALHDETTTATWVACGLLIVALRLWESREVS